MELNKKDFKNKAAYELANVLNEHMAKFMMRKKGQEFRMIIMTLSEVFQEDRYKVRSVLIGEKTEEKTGGGAKIRRVSDEKLKPVTKPAPCDGCPGSANFIIEQNKAIAKEANPPEKKEPSINPDIEPFTSEEDILDRFRANTGAMLAFCQDKEIEIPASVKKPGTIAKYIYAFYQENEKE